MERVLTLNLPVGTVAALLTAFEYLLSTLSALCARAAIHGLWLYRLHRGGEARFDTRSRTRRILLKDILATAIGVWLVLGVALVEANLRAGFKLRAVTDSKDCVGMRGIFIPERVKIHKPPLRVTIEPWVLRIAQDIRCRNGIDSVGVGGMTDADGTKVGMTAPTCARDAVDVLGGVVNATVENTLAQRTGFVTQLKSSPSFLLFPATSENLGHSLKDVGTKSEGRRACGKSGISGYSFVGWDALFETKTMISKNMTFGMHERLCAAHGTNAISQLSAEAVRSCTNKNRKRVDVPCVRKRAREDQVYQAILRNVSALFIGKDRTDACYACVSADVRVEYVFVDPKAIAVMLPPALGTDSYPDPSLPVILLIKGTVIGGHCERTVAALAQAALLYSNNAVWSNSLMAKLNPVTRFHANMMAVSTAQFPLDHLRGNESSTNSGECLIQMVREVTEIPQDARFWILVLALVTVSCIVAVGVLFRCCFMGETWTVGSAQWSLMRLMGGNNDGAWVEVVGPDGKAHGSEGPASDERGKVLYRLRKIDEDGSSSAGGGLELRSRGSWHA